MRLWLKITVCLFVVGSAAHAGLPPEAQEAYDKGVTASDKGQYLDAIADFETARQKAQTKTVFDAPEIYRKLGETEAKVPGRELRAICWLAAYLSVVPTAADAGSVKKQMADLKQTSHGRLWHLMQLTEAAGQKVAAEERARNNVETSLDTVVYLWAGCGGYEEAKKVASVIEDAYERTGAYNRVTYAQIEAGDFAGAELTLVDQEKAAESVEDSFWRNRARLDIALSKACLAKEQAKAGDVRAAQAAVAEAQQKADPITGEYERSQINGAVAVAQAMAGDIKGAQTTVEILKNEDARAEDRIDARVAVAMAQLKAGNVAGARQALVEAQHTTDETKVFSQGRRSIDLAPVIAELDHAGSGLNGVYRALSLAQAHSGDWEGSQRTAKLMDLEARKSLNSEFIRKEGVALMASSDQLPVLAWLQEIEGSQMWRRTYGLDEPLFTDYFHFTEELSTEGGNVDQKFSNFDRAVMEMQSKYSEIGQKLKEQFGL